MMQTQVNPALQALMQTAQMVTPERGPTVAAKVAQAAQQKMQFQAAPPGIEALLPGAGVQAAQSAQAAQPATQGDLNRLRQMMAQAPQGQGIAAGADVQMAEGGIVGYAGPDGSYVDPQFPRVYENYVEPSTGKPRNDREEEELFGPMKTARQRAIEAAAEELLGSATKARLAAAEPSRVKKAPAPAPADRKKPAATQDSAPAMSLPFPDTRESTAVNPSESAVNFALARGDLKDLRERLSKPTPETPEQQAYRKAQEEQYNRGIAAIGTQRQRFEDAEAARKAGLSNQARENLISFMTRVGGAGSLFRGMGQASRGMEPIIAAQRAAEQAANDKKIQYFDLLDQRKETVEGLKLAALKGDADRVAAETARLRAEDAEIAKLEIGLTEKQAGQQLTGEQAMARTQAEIDANRKLEEYRRQTQLMRPKEQDMVSRLEALKLIELTGGKPETATPAQKVQALESAIRGSRGTGVEDKAEFANLRQRAIMLQNELKGLLEADPTGRSPRIPELRSRLDAIYKELGGTPISDETPRLPQQAVSQLKEGVVTKFANGQQWTLRNGQPTQVK